MSTLSVEALPDDVETLRALVIERQSQLEEQRARLEDHEARIEAYREQIAQLEEWVRLLRGQRFGRSSEKVSPDQLGLFNEAEQTAEAVAREPEDEPAVVSVPAHERRAGGRRPLPDWMERVEVRHDLPEAEKVCAADGTALVEIGREIREQLEVIPQQVFVRRHVRPKYACPKCHDGVKIAPLPPQPIPRSVASPSLLASIAVAKYADGLPLYRQEAMLVRGGVDLSRATLAHWMVALGPLVQPLVNLIREQILDSGYVQADETTFPVLKESGKAASSPGYLWVLLGGARASPGPGVVFEYAPSRSGAVARALLEDFEGTLQTDGFAGYDELGARAGVRHLGCFAHARRGFVEALRGQGKSPGRSGSHGPKVSVAAQGLAQIRSLYAIERTIGDASPEERLRVRQEQARPLLEKLRAWLDVSRDRVPPQSLTGKALGYLDRQWPKLVRYVEDGRAEIDTNQVENAIRPFVIGRKNWLFADTVRGAQASANLYSLIETAKRAGLEPFAYLRHVFAELPGATTLAEIEQLLPHRVDRDALRPAVNDAPR